MMPDIIYFLIDKWEFVFSVLRFFGRKKILVANFFDYKHLEENNIHRDYSLYNLQFIFTTFI